MSRSSNQTANMATVCQPSLTTSTRAGVAGTYPRAQEPHSSPGAGAPDTSGGQASGSPGAHAVPETQLLYDWDVVVAKVMYCVMLSRHALLPLLRHVSSCGVRGLAVPFCCSSFRMR
jgi:hypothetical protein